MSDKLGTLFDGLEISDVISFPRVKNLMRQIKNY